MLQTIRATGEAVARGVRERIERHAVGHFLSAAGDPTWSFLLIADQPNASAFEIKTLFLQEIFERGVLSLGTHNISYAHGEAEVAQLLDVYDAVFPILREAVNDNAMRQYLRCEPLVPLFRVR